MNEQDRTLLWNRVNAYVAAQDGDFLYLPRDNPSPEVAGVEQAVMQIVERLYREKCPGLGHTAPLEKELADSKAEIERLTNNLVQTERHAQIIEQSLTETRTSLANTQTALSRMMDQRDESRRWMMRLTQQNRLPDLTTEKDMLLQVVERLRAELAFEKERPDDHSERLREVVHQVHALTEGALEVTNSMWVSSKIDKALRAIQKLTKESP